jgi:hypothetical protein
MLLIGLLAAGCATTAPQPYNPFQVSEQDFRVAVHTIALAPLEPPPDLKEKDAIKQAFESMIEKKLVGAGFTVVPSNRYQEIRTKMVEQSGGLFDPKTGKPDEEKNKAVHTRILNEIHGQFHADAVLYPTFGTFKVDFRNGMASWHGTMEPIGQGRDNMTLNWFEELFLGPSRNSYGATGAISLGVLIEDMKQAELYKKWGGIQLLAKVNASFFASDFVNVPADSLLQNQARNAHAVDFALADLMKPEASAVAGVK